MTAAPRTAYNVATLRVVPHVHLGEYINVGVVLHSRTAGFLGIRTVQDEELLRARVGAGLDLELLMRYLHCYHGICDGDPASGPIAMLPQSERFHWLTAPRSDVLQASAVHEGFSEHPERALDELFAQIIR